jgi:hypothetical protein
MRRRQGKRVIDEIARVFAELVQDRAKDPTRQ